jgi:PAS domain S-box-containing protein
MRLLLVDQSAEFFRQFQSLLLASGVVVRELVHRSALPVPGDHGGADGLQHDLCFVERRLLQRSAHHARSLLALSGPRPLILLRDGRHGEAGHGAPAEPVEDELDKSELTPALLRYAIRAALRGTAAEAAARKAETLLRLTEETAGIGIWDWDIRAGAATWSPGLFRMLGLPPSLPEHALHHTFFDRLHPEDRPRVEAAVQAALSGEAPLRTPARILRPSGNGANDVETRWIACHGEVVRDARGTPLRMIGINLDVTEHRDALSEAQRSHAVAESLRLTSERRFRAIFDSADDCMFVVSAERDGRFAYRALNPAGLAVAGAPLEAILGRTPEEVLGPVKGAEMTANLRRARASGTALHYEPSWETPRGWVTYDARYLPLAGGGRCEEVLGMARDVTALRQLEQTLQQLQKVDTLGQLAGGIAHDFNNVLAGFQSCLLLLRKRFDAPEATALLEEGLRSVGRGKALTERLLGFARRQPVTVAPLDVAHALGGVSELLRRTLGNGIRLTFETAEGLPPVQADRNLLELAILNLAINARDAMPGGGTLAIRARPVPGEEVVEVDIADTGTGMTPEVLASALEPFFTTKENGHGTGLGLSMVRAFLQQVGGDIRIESEPGRGTTVTLRLRRAEEGPAPAA